MTKEELGVARGVGRVADAGGGKTDSNMRREVWAIEIGWWGSVEAAIVGVLVVFERARGRDGCGVGGTR